MKRLYKSQNNKMICGVCGGIAEYMEVDPTLVRLVCAALTLLAGMSILVYIIAAIIIPQNPT
ncbi:MAG: PspC domain-containing protein [Oscillospiraceae bacterium]|nr:PspC domain-containing protein [Oscillospiraceae bacterium]